MQTVKRLAIKELKLDDKNRRGLSKKFYDESLLSEEEIQLITIASLVLHEKVDELLTDMVHNPELTIDLLKADKVIVQEDDAEYIVKEGNRRVSSLKLIEDVSIIDQAYSLINDKSILAINEIVLLEKIIKRIHNVISELAYVFLDEIEVICYDKSDNDTKILNTMLHRMHVKQKRAWESMDKRFADYIEIKQEINTGNVPSLEKAIENVIKRNYSFNEIELNTLICDFRKYFIITHFNACLVDRAKNDCELSMDERNMIKKRMSDSYYLPIGDVIPKMLKKGFGISYEVTVDNHVLKTKFKQVEGKQLIKNINDMVYELFISIMNFDGKRPFSNATFKSKKHFKENFDNIYNKYVSEELSEDKMEDASPNKVNPCVIYYDGEENKSSISYDLSTASKLALNSLILRGKSENNEEVEKSKIYVKVLENNFELKKDKLNNVMIDVPLENTVYTIEFYFDSAFASKISTFRIIYKKKEINPFTNNKLFVLDTTLVNKEKDFNYISFPPELSDELKDFKYQSFKYVSSYMYRGMWEQAIEKLIVESSRSVNGCITSKQHRTGQVMDINAKLKRIFSNKSSKQNFATFYGLNKDNANNIFFNMMDQISCDMKFRWLNNPPHGTPQALSPFNIDDVRKSTSKWLYIMNYLIYCCQKNQKY